MKMENLERYPQYQINNRLTTKLYDQIETQTCEKSRDCSFILFERLHNQFYAQIRKQTTSQLKKDLNK